MHSASRYPRNSNCSKVRDLLDIVHVMYNTKCMCSFAKANMAKSDSIDVLDLSHNDLSGRIPSGFGNLNGISIHLINNPNV